MPRLRVTVSVDDLRGEFYEVKHEVALPESTDVIQADYAVTQLMHDVLPGLCRIGAATELGHEPAVFADLRRMLAEMSPSQREAYLAEIQKRTA